MLTVNIITKKFVNPDDYSKLAPIKNRYNMYLGSLCRLTIQLVDNLGPIKIKDTDKFSFAADFNLLHNDNLLFYAGHDKCTILDAGKGIIEFLFIARSPKAKEKIITPNTSINVQVTRYTDAGPLIMLLHNLYAQPAVFFELNCPMAGCPRYFTSDLVYALLAAPNDGYFYGRKGDKWVRMGKIDPLESDSSSSTEPALLYMYYGFVTAAILEEFGMDLNNPKVVNITKDMLLEAVSYQYMTKVPVALKLLFYLTPPVGTLLVIVFPLNSTLQAKRDDLGTYANFDDADGIGTNGGKNNGFKFYGQLINVAASYGIYIILE